MIAPPFNAPSKAAAEDSSGHFPEGVCIDLDGAILKGALADERFAFRASQWRRRMSAIFSGWPGTKNRGKSGAEAEESAWLTWKMPVHTRAMNFLRECGRRGIRARVRVGVGEAVDAGAWLRVRGIDAEIVERGAGLSATAGLGGGVEDGAAALRRNRFPCANEGDAIGVFFRAIRVHQWAKNLLVFLPALTSHTWGDPQVLLAAGWLFVAWSLMASAVYLVNDFFDLAADRRHPGRSRRPLAAGAFPIRPTIFLAAGLAAAGLALAATISWTCLWLLSLYGLLSLGYTVGFKRIAYLDVAALSAFYLMRIVAGGAATGNEASPWLLAFSGFFFLGLAFLKRAGELREPWLLPRCGERTPARGYRASDLRMVERLGMGAGLLAALVLAVYPASEAAALLYRQPELLWITAGLLLLWQGRLWRRTRRGEMHHDPILFAARDPGSWLIAGAGLAAMATAAAV